MGRPSEVGKYGNPYLYRQITSLLMLAKSEHELIAHRSLLLNHLEHLGLKINPAKSFLSPRERVTFLGTVIDSVQMRAWITLERSLNIQRLSSWGLCAPSEDAQPHGSCLLSYFPINAAPPILAKSLHPVPCIAPGYYIKVTIIVSKLWPLGQLLAYF